MAVGASCAASRCLKASMSDSDASSLCGASLSASRMSASASSASRARRASAPQVELDRLGREGTSWA